MSFLHPGRSRPWVGLLGLFLLTLKGCSPEAVSVEPAPEQPAAGSQHGGSKIVSRGPANWRNLIPSGCAAFTRRIDDRNRSSSN